MTASTSSTTRWAMITTTALHHYQGRNCTRLEQQRLRVVRCRRQAGLALWAAVVLKLVAAGLPLLALRWPSGRGWKRTVWGLAWAEAAILVLYGVVLTTAGLLIQAGVIPTSATADHRALAWHAYLWDPWFLIWGVLVVVALWRGRRHRNQAALHSAQSNRVRRSLRRDRPHADPRRSQPS